MGFGRMAHTREALMLLLEKIGRVTRSEHQAFR